MRKRNKARKAFLRKLAAMKRDGVDQEEIKKVVEKLQAIEDEKHQPQPFIPNPKVRGCCLAQGRKPSLSTARFDHLPCDHKNANRRDPVKDPQAWRHYGYAILPHYYTAGELTLLLADISKLESRRRRHEIGGEVTREARAISASGAISGRLCDQPDLLCSASG